MKLTDAIGRTIEVSTPVQRIISLVPSYTQTLFDLGAGEKLVGRTRYCIHPKLAISKIPIVGGTKQIKNIDFIQSLHPDIILCNKEENTLEMVQQLEQITKVWISDIEDLNDNNRFLEQVGIITACEEKTSEFIESINNGFHSLKTNAKKYSVLYLIWRNPYMAAASETFINFILQSGGFINILPELKRYPKLETSEIKALEPEIVMLSSEPYPFKENHIQEIQQLLPKAKILLVDGERFAWHGTGINNTPTYLQTLRSYL